MAVSTSKSTGEKFSYERIVAGKTVTVPLYHQMVVVQELTIETGGNLILLGGLAVIT